MNRVLAGSVVGLALVIGASTSAWASRCEAKSSNGARGWGSAITMQSAQRFAMERCIGAGGNRPGHSCHIVFCHSGGDGFAMPPPH
jgi:hypothetical protein